MKRALKFTFRGFCAFWFIGAASFAQAELYECDGKWTNTPCPGEASRRLEETFRPLTSDSLGGRGEPPPAPRFSSPGEKRAPALTTLRVIDGPTGFFETRLGKVRLKSVSVRIKNIGSATAEGVSVKAILPGGEHIFLSPSVGEINIPRNGTAVYQKLTDNYVFNDRKIQIELACTNCRN